MSLVSRVRGDVVNERTIWLRFDPPFPAERLVRFLRDRAISGVEESRETLYRRSLSTPHGPAIIELASRMQDDRVALDVAVEDARAVPVAVRIARRLFDLDADPTLIARTLSRDPVLHPLIRSHRGIRLPGAASGFELAVRVILGQQISVTAARTMLGRVAARFGAPLTHGEGGVVTLFPQAERLTVAPLEQLGITSRRAAAIRRVATLVVDGELDLSGRGDPDDTIGTLLEVNGIGPWTGEYVRMRALRDPDAFPATDLGVRHAFDRLGLDPSHHAILERAEAWRPWRAYATMLLWQHEGSEVSF